MVLSFEDSNQTSLEFINTGDGEPKTMFLGEEFYWFFYCWQVGLFFKSWFYGCDKDKGIQNYQIAPSVDYNFFISRATFMHYFRIFSSLVLWYCSINVSNFSFNYSSKLPEWERVVDLLFSWSYPLKQMESSSFASERSSSSVSCSFIFSYCCSRV